MAGGNKYSLCRRTQRSPEVVNFRAADCVSPPLYLRLYMSPGEKLILLIHIRVHVDSAVARGSGDRNLHKSTPLEHELYEMLEVVRRELEQVYSHGFDFYRRRSFLLASSFRNSRALPPHIPYSPA